MSAVIDTCVLIDHLKGVAAAADLLRRTPNPAISLVTWMEVLVGARDEDEGRRLREFLGRFELLPIDAAVAERAVTLRRTHRLALPDAVILATAHAASWPLVTRNTRDFESLPGVVVPYYLTTR